ncbi:hypothetical protein GCM10020254_49080 [Streptomyces goshikiensis]
MELTGEISAIRSGQGDSARLVGEFRRAVLLVPIAVAADGSADFDGSHGGLMSAVQGGIRWLYAFTDEGSLARFAEARGAVGREWTYLSILGARLVDAVIPMADGPAGGGRERGRSGRFDVLPAGGGDRSRWVRRQRRGRGLMAGDEDLEVSPTAVAAVQKGLRGAISELRESSDAAGASQGAGFSDLAMTGMETGHPGLATDFEDFCERWEWGVRSMIQDASALARNLGIAAGTVWEEEQYIHGTFKVAANAAYGNPHATEDEIEQKSWGDIFRADVYKPDYSTESFQKKR